MPTEYDDGNGETSDARGTRGFERTRARWLECWGASHDSHGGRVCRDRSVAALLIALARVELDALELAS